jgi:N-acetylglucosamine-6-phosphate deacetylase
MGGTIYTPHEAIPNGTVLVEEGRITAVGHFPLPEGWAVVDATGHIVAPGFIDLQLNGAFGHDFTADPSTIWRVAAELPRTGVTSFLPTIITSPPETVAQAQAILAAGRGEEKAGARPLGLHVEGPFFNPAKKGAHNPTLLRTPSPAAVADWRRESHVWLVTLAPELPGALETITALRQQGVVVSAGHSLASWAETQVGFSAGVGYGTHLFNAMPPLDHRQPGLVGALLASPLPVGLIVDGHHVHPEMVRLAWRLKGGQLNLVTDAMAALGMADGVYQLGSQTVQVADGQARLADGALAGSVLALDEAVRNLIAYTGCSLHEALATVTSVPADLLGVGGWLGRVAVGYAADLVLLDEHLQVQKVFCGGERMF